MTEDGIFESASLTYDDDASEDTFSHDRYDYDIVKDDSQRERSTVANADTKGTSKR